MRMRPVLLVPAVALGLAGAGTVALTGTATAGHSNTVAQAALDGRNEVANGAKDNRIVGDPDGRGEAYVFGIDGDPTTLCYVLTVDGIAELDSGPSTPANPSRRAAHIHEGRPGANGPVVANLAWPQGGQAGDCLTDGEADKFPAVNGKVTTVAEILANPGDYYVNVHNGEYPAGAIRGQLATQ